LVDVYTQSGGNCFLILHSGKTNNILEKKWFWKVGRRARVKDVGDPMGKVHKEVRF
jgi:hypothetical protein